MKPSQTRLNFLAPYSDDPIPKRIRDRLNLAIKRSLDDGSRVTQIIPLIKHLIK